MSPADASAYAASIAVNSNGDAVAVWGVSNPPSFRSTTFWARRYTRTTGWSEPQSIGTSWFSTLWFEAAVSDNGDAIAAFHAFSGPSHVSITAEELLVNRLPADADTWSGPERIADVNAAVSSDFFRIAMDATGDAIVFWFANGELDMNRFTPSTGWSGPIVIRGAPHGDSILSRWDQPPKVHSHSVAMVDRETAVFGWTESETSGEPKAVRAVYASGVVRVDELGRGFIMSKGKSVAAGGGRAMLIAALQGTSTAAQRMQAFSYSQTSGWSVGSNLDASPDADASYPVVAMNALGQAIVVWDQWNRADPSTGARRLYANYFDGSGWKVPRRLNMGEKVGTVPSLPTAVGLDSAGNVVTAWFDSSDPFDNGRGEAWANQFRFDSP